MSALILATYATRYGSTQEVAEAITATLRESGLEVDIQPMRNVRTLAGYRAVVLGAPLYFGAWHKDAQRFLSRHRQAFADRPPEGIRPEGLQPEHLQVAVFALGPTTSPGQEKEWQASRAQLDKEIAKYPWLAPVDLAMFGGKYDPARLHLPDRLIAGLPASPLHDVPASDLRDWTAIRAWASTLAAKLQPALSQ